MIQIIDEARKKPKFLDQLLTGVQKAGTEGIPQVAQHLMGQRQMQGENQQIKNLIGQDLSGIQDPKMRQQIVNNLLKGQQAAANKPNTDQAAHALNEMEAMIGKTGVGMGGGFSSVFLGESRHNRGKFESLQAAVLPLFKSMFPRGMTEKEFKFIQEHYIPQLGDTDDKLKGKIEGLRELMSKESSGGQQPMQQKRKSLEEIFG